VSYTDSFEQPAFDPFWTVTEQFGTVSPSTDQAHTGIRSAKYDATGGGASQLYLSHDLGSSEFGSVALQFYDTNPGTTDQNALLILTEAGSARFSVGVTNFDSSRYYAFGPGLGSIQATNIPRTLGWHSIIINALPGGGDIKIDGSTVLSYTGDTRFDHLEFDVYGTGATATYYIDDFQLTASAIPEPSTAALGIVSLTFLVTAGRKVAGRKVY
jgi:hypothetical protein